MGQPAGTIHLPHQVLNACEEKIRRKILILPLSKCDDCPTNFRKVAKNGDKSDSSLEMSEVLQVENGLSKKNSPDQSGNIALKLCEFDEQKIKFIILN